MQAEKASGKALKLAATAASGDSGIILQRVQALAVVDAACIASRLLATRQYGNREGHQRLPCEVVHAIGVEQCVADTSR